MRDPTKGSGLILQLAAIVALAGLAPLVIGILLDRLLQTSPVMTLFTLALAIGAGTVLIARTIRREYRRLEETRSEFLDTKS